MLEPETREEIVRILESHGADFISIFGSRARGTEQPDSALDVLVSFSGRKSLLDLAHIERELSDSVGLDLELVTQNALHPSLRESVEQEMEVLVGAA